MAETLQSMGSNFSHGVVYHPSKASPESKLTIQDLENLGISYIRIQWVDLTNIVRLRVVPLEYFKKILETSRPGVAIAKVTMGLVYLITADAFSPMGEYLYIPDLSTLRICPYAPGHASLLGRFEEKAPYTDSNGKLTVEVALCPRSILERTVKLAAVVGVTFLVGVESEFILLKATNPVEAVNVHHWTASGGLPSGSVEATVLHEIAQSLLASGVDLHMYHPEAAPGQYEIVSGPLPPLEAADTAIHVRETIINIASKNGLRATFAPRVYLDTAGSSAHIHISVHSASEKKTKDGLSTLESSFLAGILEHLSALPAITLPIPASYKRVVDGVWSGGTYVGWGTENREAPIRLVNSASPSSRRFELRFVDGIANPHLALAAILAAGIDGIKSKRPLTIKDCLGPLSAAQMTEAERHALGIRKRLPLSWEEARGNLPQDEVLREAFGDEFLEKYLSVNNTLANALDADKDEARALTRLVEFY